MKIYNIYGDIIFERDAKSIKELVELAVKLKVNLSRANLSEANLSEAKGLKSFTAGEYNRLCFTYNYNNIQYYQLGCFNGTYKETIKAIQDKYGKNSQYEAIVTAYKIAV